MLNANDLASLKHLLQIRGWMGIANEVYWYKCLSYPDKRKRPELYEVMKRSRKNLPLYINHEEDYVRIIAVYRLKHNR